MSASPALAYRVLVEEGTLRGYRATAVLARSCPPSITSSFASNVVERTDRVCRWSYGGLTRPEGSDRSQMFRTANAGQSGSIPGGTGTKPVSVKPLVSGRGRARAGRG